MTDELLRDEVVSIALINDDETDTCDDLYDAIGEEYDFDNGQIEYDRKLPECLQNDDVCTWR